MTSLGFAGIKELSNLIRQKQVSPVEVVQDCLKRIEQFDSALNTFKLVTAEQALASAKQAEAEIAKGNYKGELHGIPVGIKDLYHTAGVRTTGGSKLMADFVPAQDAATVARLKAAGTIMIGKTHTDEFAYGATGRNPHYGPVRNPWNRERITGGSSSGSGAALAAGFVAGAMGSDTGGSIRIPAAACGVVGLKATYGLISRHGVFPLSWSLDHTGPMARSVEDVAIMLGVLAGHDPLDPSTAHQSPRTYLQSPLSDLKGCRLAVADYAYEMIEPEVRAVFDQSLKQLESLGATFETIHIEGLNDAQVSHLTIVVSEATAFHEPYLRDKAHLYGRFALSLLEAGRLVSAPQYLKAQQFRRVFTERVIKQLQGFDAMLLPTLPLSPPRIDAETVTIAGVSLPPQNAMLHFCWPANFVGLPTLSLPNGFTPDGMPSSLMLMGAPFSEDRLLRMALVYEQACNWKEARVQL